MGKNKKYINFFTTENKSGWKTRDKTLSKRNPDLYNLIVNYSVNNELTEQPFKIQIWHFINEQPNTPKCLECEKELKFKRSLSEGYGKYCSIKCTNKHDVHIKQVKDKWKSNEESIKEKMKQTNMERYGVENTFQRTDMVSEGFNKKYGVDHVSKVLGVREKTKQTNMDKYGVENALVLPENRNKSFESKRIKFLEKYKDLNVVDQIGDEVRLLCNSCNEEYSINRSLLWNRFDMGMETCVNCNPISSGDSFHEKEIVNFINTLGVDVIENDRKLLSPKEIDILIPSHKLAIEFDGVYWHNELFVEKNYHLNKTNGCYKQGYHLFHIFQDEWVNKKDIVKSIINNRLGFNVDRIYGRKCTIQEIDSKTSKTFLNSNHIQGNVNSSIKLGLFHNDTLVSLMTFGKNRVSLGQTHVDGEWEMLRFCNKTNTNIIGSASKLFKYFIKTYHPNKITSYSDNRYFDGALYGKLGFEFIHQTKPNYFYVVNGVRVNRFNYRKDKLVTDGYDPNMTEHEIMLSRKIYRIYDCGNKKWVWKI